MAYCRFENTKKALQECVDFMEDGQLTELSTSEQKSYLSLKNLCNVFDSLSENFEPEED